MIKCPPKFVPPQSARRHARIFAPILIAMALALAVSSVAQPIADPPSQRPIEGWPMAKWGMTEPEVLKAFGDAARSFAEQAASREPTDQRAKIEIDDVAVGGISFRARFLFDSLSKLVAIHLDLSATASSPIAQFQKVEDYLVPKYGQPFRGTAVKEVLSIWILQRSVIELHYAPTMLSLRFERLNGQTKDAVLAGFAEIQGKPSFESSRAIATSVAKAPTRVDQIAKAPTPVDPTSVAQSGKWRLIKSKSQFDDSRTVVLSLIAENTIRGWLTVSTPILFLRCQEKRTEIYIATGMPASVETGGMDFHTVRLRYGDEAAFITAMSQSTDNKSLFFSDPTNSISRMWNAHTLLVGFTPFNANPVTIRFDVSGLPFAIQPLRDACGW